MSCTSVHQNLEVATMAEAVALLIAQCSDDCCTKNCQAKHPKAEAVVGICDDSLGPANVLCQCQYNCS